MLKFFSKLINRVNRVDNFLNNSNNLKKEDEVISKEQYLLEECRDLLKTLVEMQSKQLYNDECDKFNSTRYNQVNITI